MSFSSSKVALPFPGININSFCAEQFSFSCRSVERNRLQHRFIQPQNNPSITNNFHLLLISKPRSQHYVFFEDSLAAFKVSNSRCKLVFETHKTIIDSPNLPHLQKLIPALRQVTFDNIARRYN